MLLQLTLQNLALVAQAEVSLHAGFNVITGETGAGKSLLLDALQLCVGSRADGGLIRHGQTQAQVLAEFDIRQLPDVQAWLTEQSYTIDDTLIIRRQLTDAGSGTIRSKVWLNGTPISLNELKTLGALLVNIHSQHAQHSLLRPQFVMEWLDHATGLTQQAAQVKQAFIQYDKLKSQAAQQAKDSELRQQKIQLLHNQLADVEPILAIDYAQLEAEYDELSNLENLMQQAATAVHLLDNDTDEPDVIGLLGRAIKLCESQSHLSQTYTDCATQLAQAQELITDSAYTLTDYAEGQSLDPERLAELDEQLSTFHRLARKYHLSPEQLGEQAKNWQNELDQLEAVASPEAQAVQIQQAYDEFLAHAQALDGQRQQNAKPLVALLIQRLQTLSLPNAQAEFQFTQLDTPNSTGLSQVELLFSANVGMPMQPIHKIASGGELSRLALVMQVIDAQGSARPDLAEKSATKKSKKIKATTPSNILADPMLPLLNTQTLVFDEVDVGISGGTAQVVGELLRELGEQQQILAITHQSQVAAMSHQHILVHKTQTDQAQSHFALLEKNEKIQELARMAGGVNITQATLDHAKSLLANVENGV